LVSFFFSCFGRMKIGYFELVSIAKPDSKLDD